MGASILRLFNVEKPKGENPGERLRKMHDLSCNDRHPFERDNIFTQFLAGLYQFDTNTNVCPSLHVIGSVAVMVSAWNSKHFHTPGWRIVFGVTAVLISVSTVFLKQHSVLDVFAAVPICIFAYYFAYGKGKGEGRWKQKQSSM